MRDGKLLPLHFSFCNLHSAFTRQIVQIVRGESAIFPRILQISDFRSDNLGQFGAKAFKSCGFFSAKTLILDGAPIQIVTRKKFRTDWKRRDHETRKPETEARWHRVEEVSNFFLS